MSSPSTASLSALATDESAQPVLGSVGVGGEVEVEEEEDLYYDQPPPGPSLGERHQAHNTRRPLTAEQKAEAARCLRSTTLFKFCSDESIVKVVEHMTREPFSEGEVLLEQGDPQTRVFLITQGSVSRLRYLNEQLHQVETVGGENHRGMFGALHVLREEPTYATALTETDGVAFTLESGKLNKLVEADPSIAKEMLYSLSKEVFRMSKLRTPLLEQDPKPNSFFGSTLGAVIESYYRSGFNSWLNAKLTGKPPASMFPMFHVQIPTRVLYINGFKTIRSTLNDYVNPADYANPTAVRLGSALVPGLMMTPVSSLLEACNAEANKEPLSRRWMRGMVPRGGREMIFGIGINQLSDACEERVTFQNAFARTAAGSMMAGVMAGYLSHIPHNVSTLKLLQPHLGYREIFTTMVDANLHRTPREFVPEARRTLATVLTFLLPKGCLIRTAQICGSFMIINGTIHMCAATATGVPVTPVEADIPPQTVSRQDAVR
ncbi:unnamed protein product [Ectocarpus fasciculatus]